MAESEQLPRISQSYVQMLACYSAALTITCDDHCHVRPGSEAGHRRQRVEADDALQLPATPGSDAAPCQAVDSRKAAMHPHARLMQW